MSKEQGHSKALSAGSLAKLEDSSEASSTLTGSESSLSKLSSQRGYSPTEGQLASPAYTD